VGANTDTHLFRSGVAVDTPTSAASHNLPWLHLSYSLKVGKNRKRRILIQRILFYCIVVWRNRSANYGLWRQRQRRRGRTEESNGKENRN
jgi:hypothetical protein